MMRVLIFHPALSPSRIDLFNAIVPHYQLKVIFLHENLLNQKFDQQALRNKLEADYDYLTNGFTISARSFRFGIDKKISAFNPDVVVTHEFSPITLTVCLQKSLKNHFRHVIWSADNFAMVTGGNLARKILKRLLLPLIDGLVLYTEEVAKLYRSKLNYKRPIGLVPNIHKEKTYRTDLLNCEVNVLRMMKSYELNGRRVLLFVGRLSREKRVDRLIKAFASIASWIKDTVFVVVGDGNELPALKQMAKDLRIESRVIFTGRQEGASLSAWYRIGSVFALTSEFEPFGAVINEALLAGMPVVCSDRAGAKSLIKNGVNGTVIDPRNNMALQAALSQWIDSAPAVSLWQMKGLRRSIMPTRFQDAADAYVELLREVAGRSH